MAAWVSNSGLLGGADLTIPLSRVTTASGAPQGDCNGCFIFPYLNTFHRFFQRFRRRLARTDVAHADLIHPPKCARKLGYASRRDWWIENIL